MPCAWLSLSLQHTLILELCATIDDSDHSLCHQRLFPGSLTAGPTSKQQLLRRGPNPVIAEALNAFATWSTVPTGTPPPDAMRVEEGTSGGEPPKWHNEH